MGSMAVAFKKIGERGKILGEVTGMHMASSYQTD